MSSVLDKIKKLKNQHLKSEYAELIDEQPQQPITKVENSLISMEILNQPKINTESNASVPISETTKSKNKKLKKLKLQHVGYRLSKRKDLHLQRRKITDIMFVLGTFGVLLMIWLVELNFSEQHRYLVLKHIQDKKFQYWNQSETTIVLRFLISISTLVLVCLVFVYHYIDIKIYCIDNTIDKWRIALTPSRLFYIIIESVICIIHPIPGSIIVNWSTESINMLATNNGTIAKVDSVKDSVPLDILLAVPMFSRLYLLGRLLMLHSRLVTDASSQSLGYLNRISFNFRFVFKAFMSQNPEYVLTCITTITFLMASWSLKACEYHVDAEKFGLLNSMWMIAITFLTVGYGDIYPITYCGRIISVLSGLYGVFCTALLVALISRKLEFSRAEKCVYQFVSEIELKKQLHKAAANVIKQGWMIYRLKKPNHDSKATSLSKDAEIIQRQRKFLVNIQSVRKIQQEQRKNDDNAVTSLEIYRQQSDMANLTYKLFRICENLEKKVSYIEDKMEMLDINLRSIQDMVSCSNKK